MRRSSWNQECEEKGQLKIHDIKTSMILECTFVSSMYWMNLDAMYCTMYTTKKQRSRVGTE